MATLSLNSGLWVRRLLNSFGEGFANGGSPDQGRCPASEVNDGACPEKPVQLRVGGRAKKLWGRDGKWLVRYCRKEQFMNGVIAMFKFLQRHQYVDKALALATFIEMIRNAKYTGDRP